MFDPGCCSCCLRDCPLLRERRALLRGGFVWDAANVSVAGAFMLDGGLQHHFPKILRLIAIFSNPGGFEGTAEIRRYYGNCGDKRMSRNAMWRRASCQ